MCFHTIYSANYCCRLEHLMFNKLLFYAKTKVSNYKCSTHLILDKTLIDRTIIEGLSLMPFISYIIYIFQDFQNILYGYIDHIYYIYRFMIML